MVMSMLEVLVIGIVEGNFLLFFTMTIVSAVNNKVVSFSTTPPWLLQDMVVNCHGLITFLILLTDISA